MELRHLPYFRAVAESKGFREAARRLHVVQPALSQTVSDPERKLGVRVLTRNSRSVRLTSEGEVFLKEANEILTHADRSVELARGAARGEIGSLSIGFLGSATSFFLPRIIREYRRRFPSVRLRLREMAPARQIDEFRAGRLDVGFTRPIPATDEAWLRSEYLYRDSLLAVLPKGHQGSARAVVSVKQLAEWHIDDSVIPGLLSPWPHAGTRFAVTTLLLRSVESTTAEVLRRVRNRAHARNTEC